MTRRAEQLFFDVFEALPRQGPGSRAATQRALERCVALPPRPAIIDLGCGGGAQTLDLAHLTKGRIIAIDAHPPLIDKLRGAATTAGLADRIQARVGDMADLDLPAGEADLIWSEGALYNLGMERALPLCQALLRPGGYLAFTEAVFLVEEPAEDVRAAFADYPTMGRVDDVLHIARSGAWEVMDHFPLRQGDWWDDFYTPMEARIAELRLHYAGDDEALAILDEIADEPAMRRAKGAEYNYEFFVLRKPPSRTD